MSDPHPLAWAASPTRSCAKRPARCPPSPRHTGRDLAGYELPDAPAMTGQNQIKPSHNPPAQTVKQAAPPKSARSTSQERKQR